MPRDFKKFMVGSYDDLIEALDRWTEEDLSIIKVYRLGVLEKNLYCFEIILQEIK